MLGARYWKLEFIFLYFHLKTSKVSFFQCNSRVLSIQTGLSPDGENFPSSDNILSGYQVCDWGISVTYREFRGLLVVIAQWQSTDCTSQGFLGLILGNGWPFHFSQFSPQNIWILFSYTHSIVNFQWSGLPDQQMPLLTENCLQF